MNQTPRAETTPGPVRTGRLSFAIFALARTHRAYAGELLRGLGLYAGQELLLMQLLERDGQTQSELLATVGLDHSTVSKSLKRMQEAGLLRREPAEHDRRAMRVWLTEEGKAMRGPLEEMWAALERASVRDLDEGTIDAFVATGETIRRSVIERHRTTDASGSSPAGLT
ncbi:MarR family winged helix-turn-helix transcriptional regulator [Streptomyces sp. N2-109]|uniref:MarR family winged helix-turn-helix transcriptional regulator n=1 Tax=Streptomyces gossypii TaxID=2883101 RepID=A0ABT2JUI1_9ACTN|nr:MarR family winged helix-turn-helix transcriptional regulator [Streptomyces gossypii]MCT2590949.1 MarR family winged helix-turn-helix transcriptional regulator [Streptomyces gossypii]